MADRPSSPFTPAPVTYGAGGGVRGGSATDLARLGGAEIASGALDGPQASYSGTPRSALGETQPDDYAADLIDPIRRMELFEEMAASDEAIGSATRTRAALVSQANWTLATASDTPEARARLEFAEDNLYPILKQTLRWLMEAQLYGFSAVEPVFGWQEAAPSRFVRYGKTARPAKSGTGAPRLWLRKMAHIRQRTIHSFIIDPTGDLLALRQWVFDGSRFRRTDIPGVKPLLWTSDRRGDDYWGNPPTRPAYRLWKFKQQLEKLNLLAFDRFGVGVPVIQAGEGWGKAEYDAAAAYAAAMRSSGTNFLVVPFGGGASILAGDGKTTMSGLEWTKHYVVQISKLWLTHGTDLASSTTTGARALGETFADQAEGVAQDDSEAIATLLNERLLVPLIDANFGPQDEYPAFAPSQRRHVSLSTVAAHIKLLSDAGYLHPTPQDEAWLREATGMPEISLDKLVAEDEARQQQAQDAAAAAQDAAKAKAAAGGAAGGAVPPAAGGDGKGATPSGPKKMAASRRGANAGVRVTLSGDSLDLTAHPEPAVPRSTTWRTPEYEGWERQILKPDVLGRDLDLAEVRATGEVHTVLGAIDSDLAAQVEALCAGGATALAEGARQIAVPATLRAALHTTLTAIATRMRAWGASQVAAELQRQETPDVAAPNREGYHWNQAPSLGQRLERAVRTIVALVSGEPVDPAEAALLAEQQAALARLAAEIDRCVDDECTRRETAARNAALAALATAPTAAPEDLKPIAGARARSALEELSTGRTTQAVRNVTNTAAGVGRDDGGRAAVAAGQEGGGPEIVGWIYSAVLDGGTCDECARWDGAFFPIDYDSAEAGAVKCPNPKCAGGYDSCRCVKIFVTAAEAEKLGSFRSTPKPIPTYPSRY